VISPGSSLEMPPCRVKRKASQAGLSSNDRWGPSVLIASRSAGENTLLEGRLDYVFHHAQVTSRYSRVIQDPFSNHALLDCRLQDPAMDGSPRVRAAATDKSAAPPRLYRWHGETWERESRMSTAPALKGPTPDSLFLSR
jgi:hypothetical protein